MNSKQRQPPQLPIEVTSWMDKDLTLRKITANSRLLTNDIRQNIVLSRQFFDNLLNLSFTRYRKMAEHEFDKKMFLRNQQKKTEISMPGLRPYVDQLRYNINRPGTSRISNDRYSDNTLLSPSTQSFLSRPGTRPEPVVNRRQPPPLFRPVQTARIRRAQPEVTSTEQSPTTPPMGSRRPPTGRQMSRETLNRLSRPKGFRYRSAPAPPVPLNTSDTSETVEEVIAQIEETNPITTEANNETTLPDKPKSPVDDRRFHQLMSSFSTVHTPKTSRFRTLRSIVEANPALQDEEGHWKLEHPSLSSRKAQLEQHRQVLAEKLNRRVDVFLVDIRA